MTERTDRELLELAAKANMITGEWVTDFGSGDYYYQGNMDGILYELPGGGMVVWNSLEDDGDALRLAVDLDIAIESRSDEGVTTATVMTSTPGGIAFNERRVAHGDDPHAATRRAIVLAAAAMAEGGEQ